MFYELTPATWQLWCFAILALSMLMAVEWDVREHRIPNVLILFVLLAGVAMQVTGPANGRGGVFSDFPGALGVTQSLLGVLVGFSTFLLFYLLRSMGAGDVKLMAALGAFVGPAEVIGLALFVLIAGGVLAVIRMAYKRNVFRVLGNVKLALSGMVYGVSMFDPATQSADRMPYALAFAGGLLAYGYWRLSGGAPLISF